MTSDRIRIAMDVVRAILKDDKQAYLELGWQLLEYSTGRRVRLHSGKKGK